MRYRSCCTIQVARVAVASTTKEVIAFLFILCQRRLACQKVIEFRGERANVRRGFVRRDRLSKFVESLIGAGPVQRAQVEWSGVSTKDRGPFGSTTHLGDVSWPGNTAQRACTEDLLEEEAVDTYREVPYHGGRIGMRYFLR